MNIFYDVVELDKNEICEIAVLQSIKYYCKNKICCEDCIFEKDGECTISFNVVPPESWMITFKEGQE